MNPMGIGSAWTGNYQQPNAPQQGSVDTGADVMGCPYDGSIARRVGSTTHSWRCQQGHQFDYIGGFYPRGPFQLGFSSNVAGGFVGTPGVAVRNERGQT